MIMDETLLTVNNLRTEFQSGARTVHAVNGVSFILKKGEILGIVGESGCGKSATCRSVIQLLPSGGRITSGEILFKGIDLTAKGEKAMRDIRGREIAMIFQEPMNTLNPVTTIREQLTETMPGKLNREKKREEAARLMRMVGIPSPEERLRQYPHQFSGGMRQRAMIAIALASKPELLIADEPTTALDVTVQQQIIRLLLDLRGTLGMAMIFITHDLGAASELCDRIAVMYAGKIVEQAPADVLFREPMHPYTRGLIQSVPNLEDRGKRLKSIPGHTPDLSAGIIGCPFEPRCPLASEQCRRAYPEVFHLTADHYYTCWNAGKPDGGDAV